MSNEHLNNTNYSASAQFLVLSSSSFQLRELTVDYVVCIAKMDSVGDSAKLYLVDVNYRFLDSQIPRFSDSTLSRCLEVLDVFCV